VLVIAIIFLVAGAAYVGLKLTPHPVSPPAPPGLSFGVPDRPLRFVCFDVAHAQRGFDAVAAELKKLDGDFVLLQEVEEDHVALLASDLGLTGTYHPANYQRSSNIAGRKASWGNVVLSKHPLYDAGPIPNPGGGIFGVWAVAVVDGCKFNVASVNLSAATDAEPTHARDAAEARHRELSNLGAAWERAGKPPMVVGGNFHEAAEGPIYSVMNNIGMDALAALGRTDDTYQSGLVNSRIDYILASPDWRLLDGGVVRDSAASEHHPIWITTRSATQP
jgi:endonuclease/exonuclease/phosphatase family metal-dependent hydrolase